MNANAASRPVALTGGRLKQQDWSPFSRPADWQGREWQETAHLRRRMVERGISAATLRAGLELADLCVPLGEGRLKLGFSRRAIRRAAHDRSLRVRERLLDRLVLVVAEEGSVLTAWLDHPRPCHPPFDRDDERR
jgi:hypothetical protein